MADVEKPMNVNEKSRILRKAGEIAEILVAYLNKVNAHIARSHAHSKGEYLGGGAKIVPPSDSHEFGAVLASHKTQGMPDDPIMENMRYEKKPALSDTPGELAMDKRKSVIVREFPFPKAWAEAARVMNIRYHADAIVEFAKKIGFDIRKFCAKQYPGPNAQVNLADFPDRALSAMAEEQGEGIYKKHREFLEYEYIKKEHASVNDYRSLVVFNAQSWYYSPYQSMTTPFLSREEAELVSEATRGNDSDVKFNDTCAPKDIFSIRENMPSKIALIPEPTTFISVPGEKEYFDDVETMKRQIVETAGEIYPNVDFSQMGVPTDTFFAQRKEDIDREEEAHAGKHAEFSTLDEIPWMESAKGFMNEMGIKLQVYFEESGMEQSRWPLAADRDHVTANGGHITGYSEQLTVGFDKIDQIQKFGPIYEKGFWLAEMHQQRHIQAVHKFFSIPMDWDIGEQLAKFQKNVDLMPKNENGDPVFPRAYNVTDYYRYKNAKAALDDEQFFAKCIREENIKNPHVVSPYLSSLDALGAQPSLLRSTGISFNSANPDDPFRITTKIEYATHSYVSMTELNSNQGRFKEIRSESMPVPKDIEEFKEAYVQHLEAIYPNIDIRQMAEMDDMFKLKECERPSMSM